MPGLTRLAALGAAPPPFADVPRIASTAAGPEDALRLKRCAVRAGPGKMRKTVCRTVDENDSVRRVCAGIEVRGESATYRESGFDWLDGKWGELSVYAFAGGGRQEVGDKIVGFG